MESFITEHSVSEIILLDQKIKSKLNNDKTFRILNFMHQILNLASFNKWNLNINKIKSYIVTMKEIFNSLSEEEKFNKIFREEMFNIIEKTILPINKIHNNIIINYFLDIIEWHFSDIFPEYFNFNVFEDIIFSKTYLISKENEIYLNLYIEFINEILYSLDNIQFIILLRLSKIYCKFSYLIFNKFLNTNNSDDFNTYLKSIHKVIIVIRNKLFQDLNSYFHNIPFKYLYIFDKSLMVNSKGYKLLNYEFFPINIYQLLNWRIELINTLIHFLFYLKDINYYFKNLKLKNQKQFKKESERNNLIILSKSTKENLADNNFVNNILEIFININFVEDFQVINNINLKKTFKSLFKYSKFINPNGSYSMYQNIDINNSVFVNFNDKIKELKKEYFFKSNTLWKYFMDNVNTNFKKNYEFKNLKIRNILKNYNFNDEQEIIIYKFLYNDIFYFPSTWEYLRLFDKFDLYKLVDNLMIIYEYDVVKKFYINWENLIKLLIKNSNKKNIFELFNILDILINFDTKLDLNNLENKYIFDEIFYLFFEFLYEFNDNFDIMKFLNNKESIEILRIFNLNLSQEYNDSFLSKLDRDSISNNINSMIGIMIFRLIIFFNKKENINIKLLNSNFFSLNNKFENLNWLSKNLNIDKLKNWDIKNYKIIITFLNELYLIEIKYFFNYFKYLYFFNSQFNNIRIHINDLVWKLIMFIKKINYLFTSENLKILDNLNYFNKLLKELYFYFEFFNFNFKFDSLDFLNIKSNQEIFEIFDLINIFIDFISFEEKDFNLLKEDFVNNLSKKSFKFIVFKNRSNLVYDILKYYLIFNDLIFEKDDFNFSNKTDFSKYGKSIYKDSYIFDKKYFDELPNNLKKISYFKDINTLKRILFFIFELLDFELKDNNYKEIYKIYNFLNSEDFINKIEFINNILWEFDEIKSYWISLFYTFGNNLIKNISNYFLFIIDLIINNNKLDKNKLYNFINIIFYSNLIKNLCESNSTYWKEFLGEVEIYNNDSFLILFQKKLSNLVQNILILNNNRDDIIETVEKIENIYLFRKLINTFSEIINEESKSNRELILKTQNNNFLVFLKNIFLRKKEIINYNYLKLDLNIINLFFFLFENKLNPEIISLNIIIFFVEELYESLLKNLKKYYKILNKSKNRKIKKKKDIDYSKIEFNNEKLHHFIHSKTNNFILPKKKSSKYSNLKKYYKRLNKNKYNKNYFYLFYIHIANRSYMLLNIFKKIDNNYAIFLNKIKIYFKKFKKLRLKNFNNYFKQDLLNLKINIPFNDQFYLYKFIKKINLKINIKNENGKIEYIYFQRTVKSYFLERKLIQEFYKNYDLTNQITKQQSLINYIKQFEIDSRYNKFLYDRLFILYYLFKRRAFVIYRYILWIFGVVIVILDYYITINLSNISPTTVDFINGYLMLILSSSFLFFWLVTKYYIIIKLKIENYNNLKFKSKKLKFFNYIKITFLESLIKQKTFVSFFTHFIYSLLFVLGLKVFLGFHIFNFIYINDIAFLIINSIIVNIPSLILNLILTSIIVYAFTFYYFFYDNDFLTTTVDGVTKNLCQNFLSCFINIFNYGFRSDIGISRILQNVQFRNNQFNKRLISDVLFYLIINITILNIIQGVIINYFNKKRQEKDLRKEDLENGCIVCNIKKQYFKSKNFKKHLYNKHNILKYYYLYEYILNLNPVDINYKETFFKDCIENNSINFFPNFHIKNKDNEIFKKAKNLINKK